MADEQDLKKAAVETIGKVAGELYADLIGPGAKQVGTAIETILLVALSPVTAIRGSFDRTQEWLRHRVEQRVAQIPETRRVPPPAALAFEAIAKIALAADEPSIRELYAELLLKAMDTETAQQVHPAFVGVVSQMSAQEAQAFLSFATLNDCYALFAESDSRLKKPRDPTVEQQFVAHCEALSLPAAKELGAVWLENLHRLRLVTIERYADVAYRRPHWAMADASGSVDLTESRYVELTEFGALLLKVCRPPGSATVAEARAKPSV